MKKLAILAAVAAFAVSAFAALDFSSAKLLPVLAPTSVSAGTTNATAIVAGSLKGTSEVVAYATAAASRTELNVTLYVTNKIEGGWAALANGKTSNTNACIVRVPFPGQYVTKDLKVGIGSIGAASTVSSFILSH